MLRTLLSCKLECPSCFLNKTCEDGTLVIFVLSNYFMKLMFFVWSVWSLILLVVPKPMLSFKWRREAVREGLHDNLMLYIMCTIVFSRFPLWLTYHVNSSRVGKNLSHLWTSLCSKPTQHAAQVVFVTMFGRKISKNNNQVWRIFF